MPYVLVAGIARRGTVLNRRAIKGRSFKNGAKEFVCRGRTRDMYYNSRGEKVSRAKFKEMYNALKNRQELFQAGLMNRRDLFKMGLLSSAGFLVAKSGLSTWAQVPAAQPGCTMNNQCASPPTTPFTINMPIMPVKQPINVNQLSPAPTIAPNTNINPATGLPFEGRTRNHQAPALGFPFPAPVVYQVVQQRTNNVVMSNQLP